LSSTHRDCRGLLDQQEHVILRSIFAFISSSRQAKRFIVDERRGQQTAKLLLGAGLDDEAVLAALVDKLGLTADEAADALTAAKPEMD
jgi:hypothetical protein